MSKVFNMVGGGGGGVTASIFVTGLSETDTVTATKGAKTLTGKWTQKPNPLAHGLPDGYTELEYIESTGTQYIDTGFYANQDSELIIKGKLLTGTIEIVGGETKFGSNMFHLYIDGRYDMGFGIRQSLRSPYSVGDEYELTLNKQGVNLIVNGSPFTATFDSQASFTSTSSAYLFGLHRDAYSVFSPSRIYYCLLKSNDTVVQNLIPCKRLSDGTIGMYDKVEQKFYTNAGTGTFIAGEEIPSTIDGFLIKPIRELGTWTVTATDGEKTATQDVLVDAITEYEIEMSLPA